MVLWTAVLSSNVIFENKSVMQFTVKENTVYRVANNLNRALNQIYFSGIHKIFKHN